MYRALISFTGLMSMVAGEEREISDKGLAEDLLRCGYIEEINASPADAPKASKPRAKKTPKGG